jgi:hypothetical protein
MSTTTNATPAQRLRAALKLAGFNARRVSVRHDHSTLRVTLRDASAALSAVQAIADGFRSVRHCEATGEILCGGNTFVEVAYADDITAPIAAAAAAVLAPAADGEIVALGGGFRAAKVSRARGATYPDEVRIWGPGFEGHNDTACGVDWAAKRIAIAYVDARALAEQTAANAEAA